MKIISTHFIRVVEGTINERQQKKESRRRACWPYSDRPKYLPDLGRAAHKIITEFWETTANWISSLANLSQHFQNFSIIFLIFYGYISHSKWSILTIFCCKKWRFYKKTKCVDLQCCPPLSLGVTIAVGEGDSRCTGRQQQDYKCSSWRMNASYWINLDPVIWCEVMGFFYTLFIKSGEIKCQILLQ